MNIHTLPQTAPACPVCGSTLKPIPQYVGGKGWTTRLVCSVKWDSNDDTCEVAK